jgi:hypothetical protein
MINGVMGQKRVIFTTGVGIPFVTTIFTIQKENIILRNNKQNLPPRLQNSLYCTKIIVVLFFTLQIRSDSNIETAFLHKKRLLDTDGTQNSCIPFHHFEPYISVVSCSSSMWSLIES